MRNLYNFIIDNVDELSMNERYDLIAALQPKLVDGGEVLEELKKEKKPVKEKPVKEKPVKEKPVKEKPVEEEEALRILKMNNIVCVRVMNTSYKKGYALKQSLKAAGASFNGSKFGDKWIAKLDQYPLAYIMPSEKWKAWKNNDVHNNVIAEVKTIKDFES